jgi:hypothetical protein
MALHDDEKWSAGGGKRGNMLGFRAKTNECSESINRIGTGRDSG